MKTTFNPYEFSWVVRENRQEPIIASGDSMRLETAKAVCEAVMQLEDCNYAVITDDSNSIVAAYEYDQWHDRRKESSE